MDTQIISTLSIHQAAEKGDLDRLKMLIEKGIASVNEIDETYSPVLHYAASGGHKEIVEFLLDRVC